MFAVTAECHQKTYITKISGVLASDNEQSQKQTPDESTSTRRFEIGETFGKPPQRMYSKVRQRLSQSLSEINSKLKAALNSIKDIVTS